MERQDEVSSASIFLDGGGLFLSAYVDIGRNWFYCDWLHGHLPDVKPDLLDQLEEAEKECPALFELTQSIREKTLDEAAGQTAPPCHSRVTINAKSRPVLTNGAYRKTNHSSGLLASPIVSIWPLQRAESTSITLASLSRCRA